MWIDETIQAARRLRQAPWYALALVTVIALGIALAATAFAIVDGVLFRPLPYRDAGRIFAVSSGWSRLPEPLRLFGGVSEAQLHDWQQQLPDLRLTAFFVGDWATIGVRDVVSSARVDASFFDVVGMSPLAGGLTSADFQTASPVRPALLTHGLWQRRFGGDLSVIGRSFVDDGGEGIRVAGILPADFVFPYPAGGQFAPEVLVPRVDRTPRSDSRSLNAIARLPPSLSADDAAARLSAIAAAWAEAHPPAPMPPTLPERSRIMRHAPDRIGLDAIGEALSRRLRDQAWTAFAVAAALMLLACLNAASLAVARARDRWRDVVLRRALGARAGDLLRAVALENGILVVVAAAAGIAAVGPLLDVTLRLIGNSYLVLIKPPAVDARVLAFSALAAAACIGLVTIAAAIAALQVSARQALADGGAATRSSRPMLAMAGIEVALALVIAVTGALVAGSLMRVWQEDPGFDVRATALFSISAPEGASAAEIGALVDSVNRMPAVLRAGGVSHAMLDRAFNGSEFDRPPGVPASEPGGFPIESVPVTHGFLEASGLTILDGRMPTDAEFIAGAPVIVVSETVAREYWPGRRAVGRTLTNRGRAYTVTGVVPDARLMSLDIEPQGAIYWPVAAMPRPRIAYMFVRLASGGDDELAVVTRELSRQCPTCWFRSAMMLGDALAVTIRGRQFSAWLFSAFGVGALLIVGVGILGLVAMTTTRRTREIGIRMALGAGPRQVIGHVLREQVGATALGLAAGGLLAAWLVRFVSTYLYKMTVYDLRAWAAAIAVLLIVAIAGALLPAWRASRIDPVRALRVE
jgi:putative ABC transport system permease protein